MMFCVAAWILVSIVSMWASMLFFLLISSLRYLYMSTSSRVWPLHLISDVLLSLFLTLCILLRRIRCGILVLRVLWCQAFLAVFLRSWWWGRHRPSIGECLPFSPVSITIPRSCSFSSVDISSMSVAYSMTDSTPSCLILSLILISLVSPSLVWIYAIRLLFSFFTIWRFFPLTLFLWRAYSMASSHALSYAFWTSRNTRYGVLPLFLVSFKICWSTMRWSTVTLFTAFFTLSFMILSNTLPTLLARVIPRSFEHLLLVPLTLYMWIMFPWTQLFEIFSSWWILLMVFDIVLLVVSLASMNNSFNIPSGPRLFFLFYFFYCILEFLCWWHLLLPAGFPGPQGVVVCYFGCLLFVLQWYWSDSCTLPPQVLLGRVLQSMLVCCPSFPGGQ